MVGLFILFIGLNVSLVGAPGPHPDLCFVSNFELQYSVHCSFYWVLKLRGFSSRRILVILNF